jgi:hypothetical protein
VLFYVALAALFACYALAYRLVMRARRDRIGPWHVLAWAGVFCLLLIPVAPITSSDVYAYIFQGHVLADLGQNPFAHLYRDFAGDPNYALVTFHNLPATTGYGPLWIAVEAVVVRLAGGRLLGALLLFKGMAAALHLAAAGLVYATLRRVAPAHSVAGALFYAWNPLLLHELVGNAHNDAAMVFLALLAFYLLSRRRWWAAVPCLVGAALVKPIALLWLPLVAIWIVAGAGDGPGRFRRLVGIGVLAAVPAVVAYAPFWAGAATFRGLLAQSDIHGNSLPSLAIWALAGIWPQAQAAIVQGVKLLTLLIFAPFYLVQLAIARRAPVRAVYDVTLFYLLFAGFQFMPWYLSWLMAPAALLDDERRRRLAGFLALAAPLLYFPFGWQWAWHTLPQWTLALLACLPIAISLFLCPVLVVDQPGKRLKELDGDGKDDGRVLFHGDLGQGLQVAELNGRWLPGNDRRRVLELLGGTVLAFGVDDLGPLFPLGLRLAGHRPLHRVGQLYVLDLDDADLDAPRLGRFVDDLLQLVVDLVAMDQQLVQVRLAQDRSQAGLGDLPRRPAVIFYLHDGVAGIDHPEIGHGVHPDRHVVAGDGLLRGDIQGDDAQVDLHHAVYEGDDEKETRPLCALQPAQTKNDAALVLLDDLDGRDQQHDQKDDDDTNAAKDGTQQFTNAHSLPSSSDDCPMLPWMLG